MTVYVNSIIFYCKRKRFIKDYLLRKSKNASINRLGSFYRSGYLRITCIFSNSHRRCVLLQQKCHDIFARNGSKNSSFSFIFRRICHNIRSNTLILAYRCQNTRFNFLSSRDVVYISHGTNYNMS